MSINQTFNSYYYRMRLDEMYYTEIEMEGMKEILRDKEEEIKKLKDDLLSYIRRDEDLREQNKKLSEKNGQLKADNEYRKKIVDIIPQDEKSVAEETIQDLQERIRFLEQFLDNKEKVNKSLREELQRYKDMWDSGEF